MSDELFNDYPLVSEAKRRVEETQEAFTQAIDELKSLNRNNVAYNGPIGNFYEAVVESPSLVIGILGIALHGGPLSRALEKHYGQS